MGVHRCSEGALTTGSCAIPGGANISLRSFVDRGHNAPLGNAICNNDLCVIRSRTRRVCHFPLTSPASIRTIAVRNSSVTCLSSTRSKQLCYCCHAHTIILGAKGGRLFSYRTTNCSGAASNFSAAIPILNRPLAPLHHCCNSDHVHARHILQTGCLTAVGSLPGSIRGATSGAVGIVCALHEKN